MVLVSLSKQGMDEMLDICWKCSQQWRYFYNAAKCKVVIFNDRPSKTNRHVFKIGPEPVDVSDSYCHLGIVCSKSLSTKVNIQDACTKLRGTYFSVVNGGIDVTSVNPIIVRTIYETMVLPKALYGCELWNAYSKQDINNLEKAHRFCVKHML